MPSLLKFNPVVVLVTDTVPVGSVHVGVFVTLKVGAGGAPGVAAIVPVAGFETHPAAFLAVML